MADAIQVLKPGWRAFDANGGILSGAVLTFFDAGTTTPRTIYSDKGLTTALGTSVTCDSGGYPTSDGSAKVEIYTGASAYKVTLKASDNTTIFSHDNIVGALDTSSFLTSGDIVPSPEISNISTSQSLTVDDQGQYFNVNCSGGDVTLTLDNAIDLGDGWFCTVRHDGSANQVSIVGTSSELFKIGSHAGVTAFSLTQRGQAVRITCDGAGFKVEESSSALFNTTGVILIADRLATPPGSPEAGARYIVTSSPTGDWSGYSQHDIAEADGQGGWFKITPPTDSGWLAYVQDEDDLYVFKASAWVGLGAVLLAVADNVATQAEMETATSVAKIVTPGRQKFHPLHPKAWVNFNGTGTVAIRADEGVASITDNGSGEYTVNPDTAFSSANYFLGGSSESAVILGINTSSPPTASTARVNTSSRNDGSGNTDSAYATVIFAGDQ
jgi:hypothetical protein